MSKPTITKSFEYKLKYNRTAKIWYVLANGKTIYIQRVASGRYFAVKDTFGTLRDAVIHILKQEGIV